MTKINEMTIVQEESFAENMPYMISLIAAMDKNHVIGSNNQMPWHLPDDLKFFKQNTLNKTVIMGRKTFESIGSKSLPNRRNLVITRNTHFNANGAEIYTSIESAIKSCDVDQEIIIMGGGELYRQTLPYAKKLYITLVDAVVEGDTVFPKWETEQWSVTERIGHDVDEKHEYPFEFITLVRK